MYTESQMSFLVTRLQEKYAAGEMDEGEIAMTLIQLHRKGKIPREKVFPYIKKIIPKEEIISTLEIVLDILNDPDFK